MKPMTLRRIARLKKLGLTMKSGKIPCDECERGFPQDEALMAFVKVIDYPAQDWLARICPRCAEEDGMKVGEKPNIEGMN